MTFAQGVSTARDFIVLLGVPGLFAIGGWLYKQRIGALKDRISLLEQEIESVAKWRPDIASAILEGQKKLFEKAIAQKEQQIDELSGLGVEKDVDIAALKQETNELKEKIEALETSKRAISTTAPEEYEGLDWRKILTAIFEAMGTYALLRKKQLEAAKVLQPNPDQAKEATDV